VLLITHRPIGGLGGWSPPGQQGAVQPAGVDQVLRITRGRLEPAPGR